MIIASLLAVIAALSVFCAITCRKIRSVKKHHAKTLQEWTEILSSAQSKYAGLSQPGYWKLLERLRRRQDEKQDCQ